MFKQIHNNLVESDEGFSVEILGREGIKYKQGSNIFYVASEIFVEPEINGIKVYKKHIRDFNGPIESHAQIDDDVRNEIIENMRKVFVFLGYNLKIEESY